jgi:hypothetical protein
VKRFLFAADLAYTFRQHQIDTCANCQKTRDQHSEDDCLFEASRFQQHQLKEFFEKVFTEGAEVTITTGHYTLKQRVAATAMDALEGRMTTDLRTSGDAYLEVRRAAKRT